MARWWPSWTVCAGHQHRSLGWTRCERGDGRRMRAERGVASSLRVARAWGQSVASASAALASAAAVRTAAESMLRWCERAGLETAWTGPSDDDEPDLVALLLLLALALHATLRMTASSSNTTRFGSLVPFAEPAAIRVRPLLLLPGSFHQLHPRHSPSLPEQDLPSPYYNESHHQLRRAARAWSVPALSLTPSSRPHLASIG